MGAKRIIAVKIRERKIVRAVLLLLLLTSCALFVKHRKDFLVDEAKRTVEALLSRESELEVRIGSVSGSMLGEVRFRDVKLLHPGSLPEEIRLAFSVKEISARYRLVDFLTKKLDTKISIFIDKPKVYWAPFIRLSRKRDFPFMDWMRDWSLSQRNNIDVHIRSLDIHSPYENLKIEGVNLDYESSRLSVEIPLRHITMGTMDVSTVLKAKGSFHLGLFGGEDSIEGEIFTEGTVVNWMPVPEESSFGFIFSRSGFALKSSRVFGGIVIEGGVDFKKDYDMRWSLSAQNYPLSNLNFLFKSAPANLLPQTADVDLLFDGTPMAPNVTGRARLYKGYVGQRIYKLMDLNFTGVYPTVKIENSRLLLSDDSVMKFADRSLEFPELFRVKTYQSLVVDAQQDTVLWGDWEFRRPKDINDQSEFLLQRKLGERARLNFHEYKRDESLQSEETDKLEIGLEYKLQGHDALKFELREDEKFVGVERKMTF